MPAGPTTGADDLTRQRAVWLTRDVIAMPGVRGPDASHHLHTAHDGGLCVVRGGVEGGRGVPLERIAGHLPAALAATHPHLAGYAALRVPEGVDVRGALPGQLAVSSTFADGATTATGVQTADVLDDCYAGAAVALTYGVSWHDGTPTLRVWAPTARRVRVLRFDEPDGGAPVDTTDMDRDPDSGAWTAVGQSTWDRTWYVYEVEVYVPSTGRVERNRVTDPWSVSLSADSKRTQIVDLTDADLAPPGWDDVGPVTPPDPAQLRIYELHVRDFSIRDTSVPTHHRGRYLAFTERSSAGMVHLRRLADAGMNAVHLLPTFDIATLGREGGFNWGYDPLHYTTPEGSYSTEPEGTARIVEYRRMVAALHDAGLGVVSDVVYNHTHAAGQAPTSVLDRLVPGYYHRLLDDGEVATSTCCPNTASEHAMMRKLMVDSVVTWARTYRVDGFRFDLMGHHRRDDLLAIRGALDALTPGRDGIDGSRIHLYGEGWNFGEVADDARFVQATQRNLAGTGIGTFNDRLRDAVRGGGPFDDDPQVQGFATGLAERMRADADGGERRARLLRSSDRIRAGLAGNLADYTFLCCEGTVVRAADVAPAPTGYTASPAENVLYVSAHDNETLYDAGVLKLPVDTPMEVRVRLQLLALSTVALGQGVSFFHAGCDLLRSKSLDRDSYTSGDRVNAIDWSAATTNFGVDLPPGTGEGPRGALIASLVGLPRLRPTTADMTATAARFRDLLALAASTPLFSLGTAAEIQQKLHFLNTGPTQIPGLIAAHLDDTVGEDRDPALDGVLTVFNATPTTRHLPLPDLAGHSMRLSPVQAEGADAVVRTAAFDHVTGSVEVPAHTTAVFVQPAGSSS